MKKFISVVLLTAMMSLTSLVSFAGTASADSNWTSFMNGSTTYWTKEMANRIYSGKVASVGGTSAYRIELRNSDPLVNGSKRSEIAVRQANEAAGDYTYSWSMYLPAGGAEDYALDPEGSEIIAQWHNVPDAGEEWTSPPLAIHTGAYRNSADRYTLEVNYDAGKMSTNDTLTRANYDLGSFTQDKGQWVDWKVHVKWGWEASQNPIIEIYKNDSKIFETTQPNTTNDQNGVKMKLGVYKWDWAQGTNNTSVLNTRVIYYNNVSTSKNAVAEAPVVDDQAAAQSVIDQINALPAELSEADQAAVKAARNAYNALTSSQKALVSNYSELTDAEASLASLIAVPKSSDATLQDLAIWNGNLKPVFSPDTMQYAVSVAKSVSFTNVTATANDAAAKVTVNGKIVASGQASPNISLKVGKNIIKTVVTAENGSKKTYTITVTRLSR